MKQLNFTLQVYQSIRKLYKRLATMNNTSPGIPIPLRINT